MFQFFTNNRLAWLRVLKNGSSSYAFLFEQLGWEKHDLYKTKIDPASLTWFGLLRDPNVRHSMGIVQYLMEQQLQACIDEPLCHPLLTSACLDAHSMPITAQIPESIVQRAHWFVIDHNRYNHEDLLRNFLRSHKFELPKVPRLHTSTEEKKILQQRVEDLKRNNRIAYDKLQMVLGADLKLYRTRLEMQHLYDTSQKLVAEDGFEPPTFRL